MERTENGRAVLTLDLDGAESGAALFAARLESVFADVAAISAQFPARTASVTKTLADWEARTGRLRSEFSTLGSTMGEAVVIGLTPAAEAMEGFMASAQRAAESFRSFVWSLFGKKTEAASEGLEAVGDSATGAAKKTSGAAAEMKRSLMAFDRINRLTADASGAAGGSSVGSSKASKTTAEELIAESPFGEYLRALLDDERYFDAGAALAAKLGELVDGMDAALTDESFRIRVKTSLTHFNETVNGFLLGFTFEEQDKLSVAGRFGRFVGDAVGLGLESIHTVLAGVRWDRIGTAAAEFINGALASLKAKPVDFGTVLADWANAAMQSLDGLLSRTDWAEMGGAIGRNVTNWFANVDWELAGRTLRDGVVGLKTTILEAFESMDIRWSDIISAFGRGVLEEDHPLQAKLLFGDGVTVPVTGVTDEVPKKNKTLTGFAARLAAWAEAFAGGSREKLLSFTAGISDWKDNLRERVIGSMSARLTRITDALTGEQKTLTGTVKFRTAEDALTEAQRTLTGTVKFRTTEDALTEAQRTLTGTVKFRSSEDALTEAQRTLAGAVRFRTAEDALTEAQRTLAGAVRFQSAVDALSEAQKTLTGTIKFRSTEDALTEEKKTLGVKARFTATGDALTSAQKTIDGMTGTLSSWKKSSYWSSNGWDYLGLTGYLTGWQKKTNWTSGGWDYLGLTGYLTSWQRANGWYANGWDEIALTGVITSWRNAANGVSAGGGYFQFTKALGGVYAGGRWRPIQSYASGGAPGSGQLFVAREAGPELVGTLGGHTAVMNNDQIVASVSAGVARAIAGIRFYSQDAATPHLAVIESSVSRSEQHLAAMAKRAEASGGSVTQVVILLRQILEALTTMDFDVKLDGASVKDRIVQLVNAHTQATGVCEIIV